MTLLDDPSPSPSQLSPALVAPGAEADVEESVSHRPAHEPELTPDARVNVIKDNDVGRDLNVGETVNVTNYVTRLAHLQPHPIAREGVLSRAVFEPPAGFGPALRSLTPDPEHGLYAGVLVLVAEPGSGARTEALRLLDGCLPEGRRIFELFPDWDEPDVSRIPDEAHTGYLLNLSGESSSLTGEFRDQLSEYALKAPRRGTRLIVLASLQSWGPALPSQSRAPLVAASAERPSAAGVTERRLTADPDTAERVAWLHDKSGLFSDLLSPATRPRAAVHLADIIARAKGLNDADARDEYLGWQGKLEAWFGGSEPDAPVLRARRIAGSFLDSCPARAVLDAENLLLASRGVDWPTLPGGVLAGPGAKQRCSDADISFRDDGTASISEGHPGIDHALLRHVWHDHPQLVPVLTTWLGRISAANGPAAPHLDKLAQSLTMLAESQGPSTILGLVQQWLSGGKRRNLAVQALDDLAVHPRIGTSVRNSLRNWAKAHTLPDRQQAVAEICGQRFGGDFTHVALNRLRDVLETTRDKGPNLQALQTLGDLLANPDLMAQALKALVAWADEASPDGSVASGSAFVSLLTLPLTPTDEGKAPGKAPGPVRVHALLTRGGEEGEAIRALLREGWRASWKHPVVRPEAAATLDGWCVAVEAGTLPRTEFKSVISVIFEEEANALGDDLNQIIGGHSVLRRELRRQYAEAIRQAASASITPPVAAEPQ
ncbi:hypothetical protein [Streptomyces sp. NPDC055036]